MHRRFLCSNPRTCVPIGASNQQVIKAGSFNFICLRLQMATISQHPLPSSVHEEEYHGGGSAPKHCYRQIGSRVGSHELTRNRLTLCISTPSTSYAVTNVLAFCSGGEHPFLVPFRSFLRVLLSFRARQAVVMLL